MVAHGTYLVGSVAIVLPGEDKLVLQDHVFRLRVAKSAGIEPELLLAALSTSFVRRQVRARQFSAEIIDKIGERHLEFLVPLPKSHATRTKVVDGVKRILADQTEDRKAIKRVCGSDLRLLGERSTSLYGFGIRRNSLKGRILIPKYYDPELEADLAEAAKNKRIPWVTLGSLIADGSLHASTGFEVGKMAYGTGEIPFVRTSDFADWEIKLNTKQGVSEYIYSVHEGKASVEDRDVLVVRDGTYLVGTSALVSPDDLPALICGGIYRLRSLNHEAVDPSALLAVLNLPLVRRQMRTKQFTRDVIDTLGERLLEVRIPSPKADEVRALGKETARIMARKSTTKRRMREVVDLLEPPSPPEAVGRPAWSMR